MATQKLVNWEHWASSASASTRCSELWLCCAGHVWHHAIMGKHSVPRCHSLSRSCVSISNLLVNSFQKPFFIPLHLFVSLFGLPLRFPSAVLRCSAPKWARYQGDLNPPRNDSRLNVNVVSLPVSLEEENYWDVRPSIATQTGLKRWVHGSFAFYIFCVCFFFSN